MNRKRDSLQTTRIRIVPILLGLSCIIEVNVAGKLMGSDLVCLFGFFYSMVRPAEAKQNPIIGLLIKLAALWYVGALVSDLIRHSDFADVARGHSRIIILVAGLAFLENQARKSVIWVVCFWIGVGLGLGIKPLVVEQYGFSDAPWKFGLGLASIAGSMLVIERLPLDSRFRRITGAVLLSMLAVTSLLLDFRSMFAILSLCAVIVYLRSTVYGLIFKGGLNIGGIAMIAVIAIAATQLISFSYSSLAENGSLGDAAQRKYEEQARLGLNAVSAGRQETLVSYRAIMDSPIIGHGSWARDPKYVDMLVEILESRGMVVPPSVRDAEVIPSHSHIVGAWVEHGALALPFWIAVLCLLFRGIRQSVLPVCRHREIVIFVSVLGIWNVLFSPFGAEQRVLLAATCVIVAGSIFPPETLRRSMPLRRNKSKVRYNRYALPFAR